MRRFRTLAACSALAAAVVVAGAAALAVPAEQLLERATAAAARQDYNASARSLEELVSAGIDGSDVLYDLGTVYARAGRYGEAIWRLEQVARRSPFAFDAQQNLRAARLRLAHREAARSGRAVVETALPLGTLWAELLPLDWAVALTLLAEIGALGCLWFYRRARGRETARVGAAAGGILLAVASVALASVVLAKQWVPPAGVVLRDGLHLLREPSADAIADAAVREGERVVLAGREGAFVRVRTVAGGAGWLAARDVGALEEQ